MLKTIACNAPYGSGGLGQHLAQLVEDARTAGELGYYLAHSLKPGDEAIGEVISNKPHHLLARFSPLRFDLGWRNYLLADLFDRTVAHRMKAPIEVYMAFGARALHSFKQARKLGAKRLDLEAANSHIANVMRRHTEAVQRFGMEKSWLNTAQCAKTIQEYQMADTIYVASSYTKQSFLEEGIPADKLKPRRLEVHPRFQPPQARIEDGVFRIVYVGGVTVVKGVPVLLEAFQKLPLKQAELILVGTMSSPGMREYVGRCMARDPRILLSPGDPLPHLHRASVCVHPTFEDGFAYAPMEALACGVPVLVTEDTGMKEHVQEGVHGYIFPTGDVDALVERLLHLYHHPLTIPTILS